MRISWASLAQVGRAMRVVGRYVAMLPSQPRVTQRFFGSLLRYITVYNHHALYPDNLPERQLHDIFPGIEGREVCLGHYYEDKAIPYGEAYVIGAISAHLRPRAVFEIGTFTGGATLLMARHAGPECEVYTLDMPPDDKSLKLPGVDLDPPEANASRIGERFRGTEYERQITQLYGDSATFDYSPYRGKMDLVFVDGSHSYSYVVNDTRKALEMLSPRGTIIWDDCANIHPGVPEALDKFGERLPISRIANTRFAAYTRQA
ncbi:MAG TPA: class I SAM-dependent methyltransferase [Chloroflexia bacterium]|nr:class I SAM-dependent methyltransferase [Chloroflexia bacterium]